MTLWSFAEVASHLNALIIGDGSVRPGALSMDTRTIQPGNCFVAIRSERDGHDFAGQAVEKGASCLLVDHRLAIAVPQLVVSDTLLALQAWGSARLTHVAPNAVFAVTGSVGKTSTKELLAAATSAWKTPGNRNNTFGLPEALATLPEGACTVVLEMGMSTPGEIRRLVDIASPDFGLITMVGTAHMENFPTGQEGIARAKGEMVMGLKPGGVWAHLENDEWCRWIATQPWAAHSRAVSVGKNSNYGWEGLESLGPRGESFRLRTPQGCVPITLRLRGHHQVRNAALAATLALEAGFDAGKISEGLAQVEPDPGRGRLHGLRSGGWLLDESYNASPDSILACASALFELPGGEPVAVLGCMRELGPDAPRIHRETGEGLKKLGLSRLWAFGDLAGEYVEGFGQGAVSFLDFEALRDDQAGLGSVPSGARILVKGSRYWRSERAVEWMLAREMQQD